MKLADLTQILSVEYVAILIHLWGLYVIKFVALHCKTSNNIILQSHC